MTVETVCVQVPGGQGPGGERPDAEGPEGQGRGTQPAVSERISAKSSASRRDRHLDWLIMAALFVFAVGVRLGVVHSSGGFEVLNGYDDGVYFGATNALIHGLVPYRDFVLLHPPGILLVGAAPVWLGHILDLGDPHTLVLVRAMFVCLGGLNTVLMFLSGRHLGRAAGLVAASLYAVWTPVIREERTMLLEPLVILGTLAALTLIPPISNRVVKGMWRPILAGVFAGLAIATKAWAVVPLVIIGLALLLVRQWKTAIAYCAATLATLLAAIGPFVVLAGRQMWDMVVVSQAGRPPQGEPRLERIGEMGNLLSWPLSVLIHPTGPPLHPVEPMTSAAAQSAFFGADHARLVILTIAMLVVVIAVITALRLPPARVWVALLVVQSIVLLNTPTFFGGYPSFVAPAGLLVVGAFGHLIWTSRPINRSSTLRAVVATGAAALVTLMAWGAVMTDRGVRIKPKVARIVAEGRCVASDSPTTLALTNRLSKNLENGCLPVYDFSGTVYALDPDWDRNQVSGQARLRLESEAFQKFAVDYFAASDYVILRRRHVSGLSPETEATLNLRPMVRQAFPRVYGPAVPESAQPQPAQPQGIQAQPSQAQSSSTQTTGLGTASPDAG